MFGAVVHLVLGCALGKDPRGGLIGG